MREQVDPQGQMFSYFSPESRVPPDHALRSIKAHTDRVLKALSGELQLHANFVSAAYNLL